MLIANVENEPVTSPHLSYLSGAYLLQAWRKNRKSLNSQFVAIIPSSSSCFFFSCSFFLFLFSFSHQRSTSLRTEATVKGLDLNRESRVRSVFCEPAKTRDKKKKKTTGNTLCALCSHSHSFLHFPLYHINNRKIRKYRRWEKNFTPSTPLNQEHTVLFFLFHEMNLAELC